MTIYLYKTDFNLTGSVNDFQAASDYLTEDDMTVYLKDDSRIPVEVRDAIIHIEWELVDVNFGHINLKANRELTEKELEYISDYVRGQNSDGLGEGFEQQDFADEYDEDGFQSDLDQWEEYYQDGYNEWYDLSDTDKDGYDDQDDYARKYAEERWGYEPCETDDSYHTMCSFDWESNHYTFHLSEEIEE